MTRDTSSDRGPEFTRRTSRRRAPARPPRASCPRVRMLCLVLCCGLMLQPLPAAVAVAPPPARSPPPPAAGPSKSSKSIKRQGAWRAGELLVLIRQGVSAGEAAALVESRGMEMRGRLRGASGIERIALPTGQDAGQAAAGLRASPLVEFAEPNYMITADQLAPNDPRFPEQWALRNTGQANGPAGADINVPAAWQQTTGSPATVIAVVDGGIDFSHPDLRNNRWANIRERADGLDDDADGYVDDLGGWDWVTHSAQIRDASGHGTSVAGVIAAEGDNAVGVAGVMWRAGLMSLRVLDSSGRGTVADAVEAIDYAAAHGASVVNCSWGLDEPSEALRDALARAGSRGVLAVVAAGNGGRSVDFAPRYPASYGLRSVLAVASTNAADGPTAWSNWGAGRVHVAAPGENIITTRPGGGYGLASGSSLSAAHASGVAGLVKTLRPDLPAAQVRAMIVRGARRVAGLHARVMSGGVLDAAGALGLAQSGGAEENDGEEGDGREDDSQDEDGQGEKQTAALRSSADVGATPSPPSSLTPPVPAVGATGLGLPDLDQLRLQVPLPPRAPPPIPSKRRRCPPRNPRCNDDLNGRPMQGPTPSASPEPTRPPVPSPSPAASPLPAPTPRPGPTPFAGIGEWGGFLPTGSGLRSLLASFLPAGGAALTLRSLSAFDLLAGAGGYYVSDAPSVSPLSGAAASRPASAAFFVPDVPTNLTVDATSDARIDLSWAAAAGAASYQVERSTSLTGTYTVVGNPSQTVFLDTSVAGDTGVNAYLYRVRAVDGVGALSAPSNMALGTAVSFLDPSLVRYVTTVKKEHFYDLRAAVDAVRRAAGLGNFAWQDPNLTNVLIKADHMRELRGKLDEALQALVIPTPSYTDPTLTTGVGGTLIRKEHVEELRVRSTRGTSVGTGGAGTGTGLLARYYDNLDLTAHKLTRTDAAVNLNWGQAAPAPGMGADQFSVRWTGMIQPRHSEGYTFYTTTDDGVRLWVDGQLVVDKWIEQSYITNANPAPLPLVAGRLYDIRMEFYENAGGAAAKLEWQSPSQAREVVPQSQLYSCWKSVEQFVRDFYNGALARQPTPAELQSWAARLANAPTEGRVVAEAQDLGRALFKSPEYADRNRTNQQYAGDLYWAYLQRDPAHDQAGWNFWTNETNANGRDAVLVAFEREDEFQEKARRLCGASAPAGEQQGYDFSTERLDPEDATGGGGANPYSRNFNWSLPILSLPGRAGLDLGLTLSYNSLVWTRDGSGVMFDADWGFPGPGFRLGFPTIQARHFNPEAGRSAYLLLTPSGARVELRQADAANVYESADSSYLQLTDNGGTMTLVTTDGTRLLFTLVNGDYHCVEVKDRNGNYVSVGYDDLGQITSVTDTLGRVVTFNYDAFKNLISITQPWKRETESGAENETHTWATFGYENLTLQPTFDGLGVIGTQPGTVIPVLRQVGLGDGSYHKFEYTPYGQVWKATHYAADSVVNGVPNESHPLSYTSYNLPGSPLLAATQQGDCPRFTERRDWAEYGVGDTQQSQVVVTSYSEWAANGASCEITLPDATPGVPGDDVVLRETYATSADLWKRGLTTRSDVLVGGQSRKWTTYSWTQDNTAASYRMNPRVLETNVYDVEGNRRRSEVTYTSFGLPSVVKLYKADGVTVLRRTETDYRIDAVADAAYLGRRVIGLVKESRLYNEEGALAAKVGYVYDDASDPDFLQPLPSAAARHDAAYDTAFTVRGNANRVRRYDVSSPSSYVETQAGYNVTGSVVFTKDAAGHQTTVGYADSFYAGVNRSNPLLQTFAYPTSVTVHETAPPAVNIVTTAQYNYDLGAATKGQAPKANEVTYVAGPEAKTFYDRAGRVHKVVNLITDTHTEWVYPASMDVVQTLTTVSDASVTNPALRAYAATALTGDGRVRGTASDLPKPGETGKYAGTRIQYDVMGRVEYRSNPTEMTTTGGAWAPAGDDANGGQWRWTRQEYDWMGRPVLTTNADGTTQEASYGGCGCAGGQVVTLRGEAVAEGRRQQKLYTDVLGRAVKAEVLNWDGSVYSATTTKYDALDRAVRVRQYVGAAPAQEPEGEGGGYQTTTLTYDGHGRLWKRHAPEQLANRDTVYTYHLDDTVQSVTDARGAKATYTYNARHLATLIDYDTDGVIAGQNVAEAPDVSFTYDAAGNRLSMDDGPGGVSYTYDQLSRLKTETRAFDDVGSYPLTYDYTLPGLLKSVKDPTNKQIDYGYDDVGRLAGVTGTPFANVTTYASNFQYRAFGAPKSFAHGGGQNYQLGYDARLRLESFQAGALVSAEFQYHADGQLRYAKDNLDPKMDRAYNYDHVGRLSEGLSGAEARGLSTPDGVYRQTYQYDVWGNLTGRAVNRFWSGNEPFSSPHVNNRQQGSGYDADGRVTSDGSGRTHTYDAAGRKTRTFETSQSSSWGLVLNSGGMQPHSPQGGYYTTTALTLRLSYDGDGRSTRRAQTKRVSTPFYQPVTTETAQYYVRSTVLGGRVVTELNSAGQKEATKVYAGRAVVAEQKLYSQGQEGMAWQHRNPLTGTEVEQHTSSGLTSRAEYDPWGLELGTADPYLQSAEPDYPMLPGGSFYRSGGNPFGGGSGCMWDGVPLGDCRMLGAIARSYDVVIDVRTQGHEGGGFGMEMGLSRVWHNGGVKSREIDEDDNPGPWSAVTPDRGFYWQLNSIGFFSQPPSPQDAARRDLPDDIRKIYTDPKNGRQLTKCINEVFGVDANQLEYQQLRNAPIILDYKTAEELGTTKLITGEIIREGPFRGLTEPQKRMPRLLGNIWIAKDLLTLSTARPMTSTEILQRTYVHELGNLLAFFLTDGATAKKWGDPNGIVSPMNTPSDRSRDRDTGAKLEKCFFNDP